jgi:flagellar biosynthetic protein FlhB
MADEDDASKTEDPTGRKLSHGRDEGQVAQSQEIRNWMALFGAAIGLMVLAKPMSRDIERVIMPYLAQADAIPTDFEHLRATLASLWMGVGIILAPLLALFVVLAFLGNVGQFGLLYAPAKIQPKWEKISPLTGFKRLVSMKAVVEFLKSMIKISAVAAVSFGLVMPHIIDFQFLFGFEMGQLLDRIYIVILSLTLGSVAVMTAVAGLDYAYQRFNFMKDMRMTKHEVKEEHRQTEGDPQIKARIRRIRNERARKRMMAAVPKADVVITNPTHFAVALEYKMKDMDAPRLVAKGIDQVAFRIRQVAEEHEIPVVENPPLARALYATVELDQEIPPEHYKAVAEVIGYVMRLKGQLPATAQPAAKMQEQTIRT